MSIFVQYLLEDFQLLTWIYSSFNGPWYCHNIMIMSWNKWDGLWTLQMNQSYGKFINVYLYKSLRNLLCWLDFFCHRLFVVGTSNCGKGQIFLQYKNKKMKSINSLYLNKHATYMLSRRWVPQSRTWKFPEIPYINPKNIYPKIIFKDREIWKM